MIPASIVENTLYFLALINPASKVFLLCSLEPEYSWKELFQVAIRSTFIAFLILSVLAAAGTFLLKNIFKVDIYSLNIAGGIVLFIVGLTAVKRGRFYEEHILENISDISVVPLAAPLIAGPGTITAAISFSSIHGCPLTILTVSLALFLNLLIMLSSLRIGHALERMHATGPLIRITGLIVASVAVQMILSGLSVWIHNTLQRGQL